MNILVINAGSSSLKYQLMNPDTGDVTAKGLCERIGLDGRLTHKVPATGKKVEKDIPARRRQVRCLLPDRRCLQAGNPRLHPARTASQPCQPYGH